MSWIGDLDPGSEAVKRLAPQERATVDADAWLSRGENKPQMGVMIIFGRCFPVYCISIRKEMGGQRNHFGRPCSRMEKRLKIVEAGGTFKEEIKK